MGALVGAALYEQERDTRGKEKGARYHGASLIFLSFIALIQLRHLHLCHRSRSSRIALVHRTLLRDALQNV